MPGSYADLLREAQARQNAETRAEKAEARLESLRAIWLEKNVGKNSFYINGFTDRLEQLADLYDEEIANKTRAILEADA